MVVEVCQQWWRSILKIFYLELAETERHGPSKLCTTTSPGWTPPFCRQRDGVQGVKVLYHLSSLLLIIWEKTLEIDVSHASANGLACKHVLALITIALSWRLEMWQSFLIYGTNFVFLLPFYERTTGLRKFKNGHIKWLHPTYCQSSTILKAMRTLAHTINWYMMITSPVQNFGLFSAIISSMGIIVRCELIENVLRDTKNIWPEFKLLKSGKK